jgi:hypothetical protein
MSFHNSTFDVGSSMFDVQSFHCSGQAEFHTSLAAGCQNDQFDRKLDFGNISYERRRWPEKRPV